MASAKKKASKSKKAKPSAAARKPAPKPKVVTKVVVKPDPKTVSALRTAKKEADAGRREAARLKSLLQREEGKLAALRKEVEEHKSAEKSAVAGQKAFAKQVEAEKRAAERDAERARREAERKAEQERKAAEREAERQRKAEEKATAQAEAAAAKAAAKVKRPVMSSLAASPIIRPLTGEAPVLAPPPPPAKPGHVDHQVLSAMSYGLFAAVNKTFGFAGQTVVKNASLRMLEYGYKRGWLPPKSKEPVRALNEFFGRLETMGYADKIHVAKHGDKLALEVQGLADFDAVHELRTMHYPLLPIFLGEMLVAIVDQYFHLRVSTEPMEMQEQKRGFILPFAIHEQTATPEISRLPAMSRVDEFEE
jgi:hypothetical protein